MPSGDLGPHPARTPAPAAGPRRRCCSAVAAGPAPGARGALRARRGDRPDHVVCADGAGGSGPATGPVINHDASGGGLRLGERPHQAGPPHGAGVEGLPVTSPSSRASRADQAAPIQVVRPVGRSTWTGTARPATPAGGRRRGDTPARPANALTRIKNTTGRGKGKGGKWAGQAEQDPGKTEEQAGNSPQAVKGPSIISYNLRREERLGGMKVRYNKIKIATGRKARELDERQADVIRELLQWARQYRQ